MIRNNSLKISFFFVLLVLLITCVMQVIYWNKLKSNQISSFELQNVLNLSSQIDSNLELVQKSIKENQANPSLENLYKLKNYQTKLDSLFAAIFAVTAKYSTINFYIKDIPISSLISNKYNNVEPKKAKNKMPFAENVNSGNNVLLDTLKAVREETKSLLSQKNAEIISYLNRIEIFRFISYFLVGCSIIIIYFYNSGLRKSAFAASYSRKSLLMKEILLMRSLLDATSTIMFIIDKKGKCLFVNKSFLNFFDINDESEVVGKPFSQLKFKHKISFESTSIIEDSTVGSFEKEEVAYVDDKKFNFFTRKFPIRNNDGEISAFGVVRRNITERILNEEGLKKSRYDAEQAKLTQEQFMANISHEIRTPMNGIMGMTDLLAKTYLSDDQKDYLQTIDQSSKNLMVLINDILDFSKIEAGKLELEYISFKISDVIEQLAFPLRARAREKNLDFNLSIDHKVPLKVIGDPLRLNQIITNILSNAIKFTPEGSVSIKVSAKSYISPLIKIVFEIEDTGIGIPQDRIDHIFQSFTQTSLDVTRKFGGTGLGLAIVKQLVELHEGTITVKSEEDKGSVFTIEIPYKPTLSVDRTEEENLKFALLNGKNVLVVEDNFINQKVILQTLKNIGITASLVDNGYSALEILKKNSFDLIIMDIQMPGIDGCETTIKIREELKLDVPIIAMTASAMQEDRDKCRAAGMNEYISKPFVTEDLFEKLLLFV